jgi:hypothetical protein
MEKAINHEFTRMFTNNSQNGISNRHAAKTGAWRSLRLAGSTVFPGLFVFIRTDSCHSWF